MSKGLKIFLMLMILVVFGAIAYFLLGDNPDLSLKVSPTASPLQTSTNQPVSGLAAQTTPDIDADQIGQEFLTQLLNIRTIKLREDIFSRPAFVSLTDFTIELIQLGNEGRVNPFAPFGVDGETPAFDPLDPSASDLQFPQDTSATPFSGSGNVVPVVPSSTGNQVVPPPPSINNS